ncbi:DMT family transporter [Fusibacter sp. Q10-2]|uniref:DMT family transporter n=2 Tax=Fusibacter ferrireducens TaxID=2785058 RepID=A0ABR9ZTZ7_9FIRM|nr:DMT family transporter [Fusibacter ferrireducens]
MKPIKKPISQKNKAIIAMLISAFSFSIMGIAVKLAVDIPVYEKVFFRNFVTLFFAYRIVRKNNVPIFGTAEGRPYLIGRCISGVLGIITMFYALSKIDVATATTIQKLSQFWVLIFAAIFLKEKIKPKQYLYLVFALVGVIIVSKPSAPDILIPTLICFSSSIFAGIAYTFLSKLKNYEHPSTVVFFFSLFSTVVMFIPMMINFKWFTLYEFILLVLMGVGGLGGQVFITNAYHYAEASEVSIYAYANIVFSAGLSLMIWGTLPDAWSLVGIVIIISASYLNYKYVKNGMDKESVSN